MSFIGRHVGAFGLTLLTRLIGGILVAVAMLAAPYYFVLGLRRRDLFAALIGSVILYETAVCVFAYYLPLYIENVFPFMLVAAAMATARRVPGKCLAPPYFTSRTV